MSLENASLIVTPNAYKAGKLYSVLPEDGSGDFTASRATTATRVNENGLIESVAVDVPRIDYTNGNCPSILVEGQKTNAIQHSEDLNDSYWLKLRTNVTANDTIAPDGNSTADSVNQDSGQTSSGAVITDFTSFTIGEEYTLSVFAKPNGKNYIALRASVASNGRTYFDVSDGTIGDTDSAHTAKIQPLLNGWYRCSITFTAGNTLSRNNIYLADSDGNTSVVDSGGVFMWGAQLEEGTEASSYIPTTSSAVTRNADVLSTTVPAGITEIVEELEDGTTNTITNIPATYTPNPNRYKYILMQ